tara:strand:- start:166 stop:1137 length:972 start_codon:yes stop_codon:yes gene_type:complete
VEHYCTYFDRNFLPRGLALYLSLERHLSDFRLWVLCLDSETFAALSGLGRPKICPIRLEDFERGDDALLEAKQNRTRIEYYFTCTPSLPLFVLRHSDAKAVTYVDADLFFYASPSLLLEEVGAASIAIVPHRRVPEGPDPFGDYNVGWLRFLGDEMGVACLGWWRDRCNEWCYDRVDGDRFADQKYLNHFPARYDSVAILEQKGANLAPWNVGRWEVRIEDASVRIDEDPLIFYHFHGLKLVTRWLVDPGLEGYATSPPKVFTQHILRPYLRDLKIARRVSGGWQPTTGIKRGPECPSLSARMKTPLRHLRSLLTGQYVIHFG